MFSTTPEMNRTIESMFAAFDSSGASAQFRKTQFVAQLTDLMVDDHANEDVKFSAVKALFLGDIIPVLNSTEFHSLGPVATGPVEAFVNRVRVADTPRLIGLIS